MQLYKCIEYRNVLFLYLPWFHVTCAWFKCFSCLHCYCCCFCFRSLCAIASNSNHYLSITNRLAFAKWIILIEVGFCYRQSSAKMCNHWEIKGNSKFDQNHFFLINSKYDRIWIQSCSGGLMYFTLLKTDMDDRSIVHGQKLGSFIVHRIYAFSLSSLLMIIIKRPKLRNWQWNALEKWSHGMFTNHQSKLKSHHPSKSCVSSFIL